MTVLPPEKMSDLYCFGFGLTRFLSDVDFVNLINIIFIYFFKEKN